MGTVRRVRWRRRPRPRPRPHPGRFQPGRHLIRAAISWFLEWPAVLPTPPSQHSRTAESLALLQNQRGRRVCFLDIRQPETQKWESGRQAMQDTLHLEKCVHQSLLDLHQLAIESCDADLCHCLGTGYPDQQVKFIKELEDHVSSLSNAGSPEGALAEYFSDKLTLGDGDKED
ncbi:ferritin heavy chain-like [Cervus elaphus]|uniref:ferritin heavy chain-like n=1 Tax=Cervus elaphus TaxID=9860 RepID=UPI001CC2971D|nr:ferritin heavy chain-like [Cervus elaphus]XP_043751010.1 ferritin heavy chain-like [Cervus elaphus]